MITFTLSAVETMENNERTGRELHFERSWHTLPRIQEILPLYGNEYVVSNVYHEFGENKIIIEFRTAGFDFEILSREGWIKIGFES